MISEQFNWLQITEAIWVHCRKCELYQLFKEDTWKLAGLYQPLPVLQILWEQIHIGFVMELPECDGYRIIMKCIDYFSKVVLLVLLKELDAQTIASRFLAEGLSHH